MLYHISPRYGIAWFRFGKHYERLHIVRAPWCPPLFSERNGYENIKRFMGWRYTLCIDPLKH